MRYADGSFKDYDRGQYITQWPQRDERVFSDFSGGLFLADTDENVPPNASPDAIDVYVDEENRLTPVPGTTILEVLDDYHQPPVQLVEHGHLNGASELLLFSPPYIGIWSGFAPIIWFETPLRSGRRVRWTVHGETLVFTDGFAVYRREPFARTIQVIEDAPISATYCSFAGRVMTGAGIIDGAREPLLISWSAVSGLPTDWFGLGGGFELLIDESTAGDEIISLHTFGLDFVVALLRRSIWVGRRTGLRDRPVDFQLVQRGAGTFNAATCQMTESGLFFLDVDGVRLFDGKQSEVISHAINRDLLPVDEDRLDQYFAVYDRANRQYILYTPSDTWVYSLLYNHWIRRSIRPQSAASVVFYDVGLTWEDLLDTGQSWEDLIDTGVRWLELMPQARPVNDIVMTGEQTEGHVLVRSDDESVRQFGRLMQPFWRTPVARGEEWAQLFTLDHFEYIYSGEGRICFQAQVDTHDFVRILEDELDDATQRLVEAPTGITGRGLALRAELRGPIKLCQFRMRFTLRSLRATVARPSARMRRDLFRTPPLPREEGS